MATVHTYTVRSTWTGDRNGSGQLDADHLSASFSVPGNLGGPGLGTNPEELLVSAAAGCYLITLCTLLTNRQIPFIRIELTSHGYFEFDRGLRFDRMEHHPVLVFDHPVDDERIIALAEHAEHACMVSSALRGNVSVTVHPQIRVQSASR
ncbi:MAG: OsmC family protein [Alicyclobacillaceae bacterium]|nr:OsmC family protein [Alicyclobacillaceae bacterium]